MWHDWRADGVMVWLGLAMMPALPISTLYDGLIADCATIRPFRLYICRNEIGYGGGRGHGILQTPIFFINFSFFTIINLVFKVKGS